MAENKTRHLPANAVLAQAKYVRMTPMKCRRVIDLIRGMPVAQALDVHLSVADEVRLLLVLLLTSKGAAGVTGSGFVTLAATLATTGSVPVAGITLLLGVDRFMSEARALTNLVGNAVTFSPADGIVLGTLELTVDSTLRFTVTDEGPGVPEEFRPLAFDRFSRADESRRRVGGGTGLGLALVRSLAAAGWHVVTDGRDPVALGTSAGGISGVVAIPGDVTDPGHRAALIAAVGGPIDLLVNNAGGLGPSPLPALADYPLGALADLFAVVVPSQGNIPD